MIHATQVETQSMPTHEDASEDLTRSMPTCQAPGGPPARIVPTCRGVGPYARNLFKTLISP